MTTNEITQIIKALEIVTINFEKTNEALTKAVARIINLELQVNHLELKVYNQHTVSK